MLDKSNGALNDEEAPLANIDLLAEYNQERRLRAHHRARTGALNTNSYETPDGEGKPQLLSKYDEEEERAGFLLGADGRVAKDKEQRLQEIRDKLNAKNKERVSLSTNKLFASDFEEPAKPTPKGAFKKRAKDKSGASKRKALEAIDELVAAAALSKPAGEDLLSRSERTIQLKEA